MKSDRGRHFYIHGLYSGYTDFRYSEDRLTRRDEGPIYNADRRASMAVRVADMMDDWTASPFEYEGPIRHQLRRSLCLAGYSWARADAEALAIVDGAIAHLGLERPTHEEGQPDHARGTDYCSWCACPIDEEGRTRSQRFCSPECAQSAIDARERKSAEYVGVVLRSAARLVTKSKAPPRTCVRCGISFQSDRETAFYCSPKCANPALPEIDCENCDIAFKPMTRTARFCSPACSNAVTARERLQKLALQSRDCQECGKGFAPTNERSRFCSTRCGSRARSRDHRERGGVPSAYTMTCRGCGIGFTSQKPKAPFCGRPCKDLVERYEQDKHKRLTHRLFDYMVHRQGVEMSGLAVPRVTDGLFPA